MSTLATDDFNRADGGLGSNWTTHAGSAPQISSNHVVANGGALGLAYYNAVTWPNDQWSQVVVNSSGGNDGGVMVRASGTNGYYVQQFGGTLELKRYDNGSGTNIATAAGGLDPGETLYLEMVSTALVVKVAGSQIISTTDGTVSSGSAGIVTESNASIDDWAGGDFVQPATRIPFVGHTGRNPVTRTRYAFSPERGLLVPRVLWAGKRSGMRVGDLLL